MHLTFACVGSWLALLGAFATALIALPTPRSVTDIVVIVAIGAAALLFSRLGLGAVLALAVRLLPAGHLRSAAITAMLRIMPTMLRSTALAAASATLALQAAHGAPAHDSSSPRTDHSVTAPASVDDSAADTAAPAPDPGWPTSPGDDPPPRDPGWPTDAPAAGDSPVATPPSPDSSRTSPKGDDEPDEDPAADTRPAADHVVRNGESLWSIAEDHAANGQDTEELVAEIYADNRDRIGPDPNLIMPGQRLEISQ